MLISFTVLFLYIIL